MKICPLSFLLIFFECSLGWRRVINYGTYHSKSLSLPHQYHAHPSSSTERGWVTGKHGMEPWILLTVRQVNLQWSHLQKETFSSAGCNRPPCRSRQQEDNRSVQEHWESWTHQNKLPWSAKECESALRASAATPLRVPVPPPQQTPVARGTF